MELAAKAGALRQMLLEMLEHPEDIRKMTIMGRTCTFRREDGAVECSLPLDKQSAEGTYCYVKSYYTDLLLLVSRVLFVSADEEEEIEMLLEYYLQR